MWGPSSGAAPSVGGVLMSVYVREREGERGRGGEGERGRGGEGERGRGGEGEGMGKWSGRGGEGGTHKQVTGRGEEPVADPRHHQAQRPTVAIRGISILNTSRRVLSYPQKRPKRSVHQVTDKTPLTRNLQDGLTGSCGLHHTGFGDTRKEVPRRVCEERRGTQYPAWGSHIPLWALTPGGRTMG
ncbi:hypothetical protein Q8A73_008062 [Channa argus]|nr:hypothetical protein Q8A73_008062 [Channa argus]